MFEVLAMFRGYYKQIDYIIIKSERVRDKRRGTTIGLMVSLITEMEGMKHSLFRWKGVCVSVCGSFLICSHRAVWLSNFPRAQHRVLSPWLLCQGRSMAFIYSVFPWSSKWDLRKTSSGAARGREGKEGAAACLLHERTKSCADNMLRVWENGLK